MKYYFEDIKFLKYLYDRMLFIINDEVVYHYESKYDHFILSKKTPDELYDEYLLSPDSLPTF